MHFANLPPNASSLNPVNMSLPLKKKRGGKQATHRVILGSVARVVFKSLLNTPKLTHLATLPCCDSAIVYQLWQRGRMISSSVNEINVFH